MSIEKFGIKVKTVNAISGLDYLHTGSRFSTSKFIANTLFRLI
jgi:hypothetical protein